MFKLLRYFSVTSAIVMVGVTILLSTVYWQSSNSHLIKHIEGHNVVLAQSFANTLWPQYRGYVTNVSKSSGDALRARSETQAIHATLKALTANLPVLKVKMYNLEGLTVYSSEFSQMGASKEGNARFKATVKRGSPTTKNSFRATFPSFDGLVTNRHLVESYLPIYGPDGQVEGVFGLYTDVTALVADINKTTTQVVLFLLLCLGLLYCALYFIVRRADRIMGRQVVSLEQANRNATAATRAKSEFLANMSHELRTPLNSIMILSKMLSDNKDRNLTLRQSESATIIHNSGRNLLALINNIFDLSKVEVGKIDLTFQEVEIKTELDLLLKQFEPIAQEKGLKLTINLDRKIVTTFRTDSLRFLQILKNLFENAIKFTSTGSITLNIGHPENVQLPGFELPHKQIITFSVTDTGIGIPDEKRGLIFNAFQQAEGTINRQYGSTGLGLTISRELATLLGGELHLSKSSNAGSTFTLYLPIDKDLTSNNIGPIYDGGYDGDYNEDYESGMPKKPKLIPQSGAKDLVPSSLESGSKINNTSAPHPSTTHPGTTHRHIPDDQEDIEPGDRTMLIIEDDSNFAKNLQNIARERGYKTIVTNMGFSGLILARTLKPSAIYLDLGLPDIGGLSVLDQLKCDLLTRHIPIHIVSAREDNKQVIDMGAIGFLRKPISSEELEQMFAHFDSQLGDHVKKGLVIRDDEDGQIHIENLIGQHRV